MSDVHYYRRTFRGGLGYLSECPQAEYEGWLAKCAADPFYATSTAAHYTKMNLEIDDGPFIPIRRAIHLDLDGYE